MRKTDEDKMKKQKAKKKQAKKRVSTSVQLSLLLSLKHLETIIYTPAPPPPFRSSLIYVYLLMKIRAHIPTNTK